MPIEYKPQIHRPNPHKPSVCRDMSHGWQARGYDEHFIFHNKSLGTWDEAVELAFEWARDGYPDLAPEVTA